MKRVRVLFVGTGTVIPGYNRFPTGVLIDTSDSRCLLDLGPGLISRLGQHNIYPEDLDCVFISHFHLDHIADITTLLFIAKIKEFAPPLLVGPKGLSDWLNRAKALYDGQIIGNFNLSIREVSSGDSISLTDLKLSFFKTQHTEESLGVIVETMNKTLIYTSDTEFDYSIVKEIPHNPDLLVTECSLPVRVKGHMHPEALLKLTQLINPRVLAAVHLYPQMEPDGILNVLQNKWSGKLIIPDDGYVLEV